MAQAFAYQNGECYKAEKIELAYAVAGEAAEKPEQKPEETTSNGASIDNTDQAV